MYTRNADYKKLTILGLKFDCYTYSHLVFRHLDTSHTLLMSDRTIIVERRRQMGVFDDLKKGSTNQMINVLVDDVFEKHQVEDKLKNLSPQKKEKIRRVVSDIQQQVDQLIK
jgi:spore coat protein W